MTPHRLQWKCERHTAAAKSTRAWVCMYVYSRALEFQWVCTCKCVDKRKCLLAFSCAHSIQHNIVVHVCVCGHILAGRCTPPGIRLKCVTNCLFSIAVWKFLNMNTYIYMYLCTCVLALTQLYDFVEIPAAFLTRVCVFTHEYKFD